MRLIVEKALGRPPRCLIGKTHAVRRLFDHKIYLHLLCLNHMFMWLLVLQTGKS